MDEGSAAQVTSGESPASHQAWGDLAGWVDETGGLLATCDDISKRALLLAGSLHDHAWFKLDHDELMIATHAGGRQGCVLGPVMFNMI